MVLPLVPLAVSIASTVLPSIVGMIAGDDGERIAQKVVDIATDVAGVENPNDVAKALESNPELVAQMRSKMIELEAEELREETKRLIAVNETMRAEALSSDAFTRRWRPYFGYIAATTWGVQMTGLTWVIVFEPAYAAEIVGAMAALSTMWGIALAVLGVNIHSRSQDKKTAAGVQPKPLLDRIFNR